MGEITFIGRRRPPVEKISFDCFFPPQDTQQVPEEDIKIFDISKYGRKRSKLLAERLLYDSPLPPIGDAYTTTYVSGDIKYHVVAVSQPCSWKAVEEILRVLDADFPSRIRAVVKDEYGFWPKAPEHSLLLNTADSLNIRKYQIQCSPYDPAVVELANVSPAEALSTAIGIDFLTYYKDAGYAATAEYLNDKYKDTNIPPDKIVRKILESWDISPNTPSSLEKKYIHIWNLLTAASNYLSKNNLEPMTKFLKSGEILVLSRAENSCVFDPHFRPNP